MEIQAEILEESSTTADSTKTGRDPLRRATTRFPGLNGLRFLAAFAVFIHHGEEVKYRYGFPNGWLFPSVQLLGSRAVSFFFVLSGFLITYLLIEERERRGFIDVPKFYFRRMLRIWPLYFVIVGLSFFILPLFRMYDVPTYTLVLNGSHFWPKLALYVGFAPQVCRVLFLSVAYAGVLWSIGVEEWFYALWPWLVGAGQKVTIGSLLGVALILPCLRWLVPGGPLNGFLNMMRFDCMAVGGLTAILLIESNSRETAHPVVEALYRIDVQFLVYLWLTVLLVRGITFGQGLDSVLFSIIILNVATNRATILSFESRLLNALGEISYGMYCYNWIAIVTGVRLAEKFFGAHANKTVGMFAEVIGLILTLAFSIVSYRYIERPFLRLKTRSFTPLAGMMGNMGQHRGSG